MKRLCIVTALAVESRAWLDHFSMRQIKSRHIRLYGSEHHLLLETGVGKLNAAAATAAMLQAHPDVSAIVNIGIAGGCLELGQTVLAHQVVDQASGMQWFPHIPTAAPVRQFDSCTVRTMDAPCSDYSTGNVFDMECAGIFSAASHYLSSNQVHSVKVISDNPDIDYKSINKQRVKGLITDAAPSLIELLDVFAEHITKLDPTQCVSTEQWISQTLEQVHHSVNDEHQLRQLVRQLMSLGEKIPQLPKQCHSAKTLRLALQEQVSKAELNYE